MRSYRDFSIRLKAGAHLALILLLFAGQLIATWWFLQQPTHHGIQLQLFLMGGFGVGLLVITLLFVAIDRHVIRPLEQIESEIKSIAQGHFDTSITTFDSSDEIGTLSYSLEDMKNQLVSAFEDRKRFEQAVRHAGHAVYITDIDGTIEYVNPAFEEITKYREDETLGENPRILQSGHHSTSYYEELWETILSGDTWEEQSFVNKRATGELFLADQTIAPITDENDKISGFVGIMSDRTEDRIRDQQTQVLSRVLRHNLRTELNLIDGYAREIQESETTETQAEYVHEIRERVEMMERVSAKAEQTIREIQREVFRNPQEVCAAIERICVKMEEQYPKAVIRSDLPNFEIDVPVTIESVLEELVENAIEHNDQDTPEVTIQATLQEEEERPPPTVLITVNDNGPGVPDDERLVIEKGRETPLLHGSGLGLWFVHWVVTLVGGEITISERSPRGTRVSLILPRGSVSPFPRHSTAEDRPSPESNPDNKTNTQTNE